MSSQTGVWLGVLLPLLVGLLLGLRLRFPQPSRRSETLALMVSTIVLFSLFSLLLPH
jgi:hypothetical protein